MPEKENGTIITHAKSCFQSFDELPFNELDSALFCWISYLCIHEDFSNSYSVEGMPLVDLLHAEYFQEMLDGTLYEKESMEILFAVVSNPRYRSGRLKFYRFENNMEIKLQFSAMTISFSDSLHFVAFRGTDKSINGWKEDVLLLGKKAAPGQLMSIQYLNSVGAKLQGEIIVGGHSKGGNLAVYASAHCHKDIQDRISAVYNHDGPGFRKAEQSFPGLIAIRDRIHKTIPVGSPVGLILENEVPPKYVHSTQIGVMRHMPFTWVTRGYGFGEAEARNNLTGKVISNINTWAETLSDEEVTRLMNDMFEFIDNAGVTTTEEVFSNPAKYLPILFRSAVKVDASKREYVFKMLRDSFTGRQKSRSEADTTTQDDIGVEWDRIEVMMNDSESQEFQKEYDLFI